MPQLDPSAPPMLVRRMEDAARRIVHLVDSGKTTPPDLVKLMKEILDHVEALTIKLSVSHKNLVADADFRGSFMNGVRVVQNAIEAARSSKSCCCMSYMGNSKLRAICEKVWHMLETFSFQNFKLDLGTSGHVGMTGESAIGFEHGSQKVQEAHTYQQAIVPLDPKYNTNDPPPQPSYLAPDGGISAMPTYSTSTTTYSTSTTVGESTPLVSHGY